MAKDRRKLQHIHSSIPDKQPTPQSLEVGEIAVNNAANQEFLSIKNSDDVVKRFSSDEQIITWMERKEVMPYEGYTRGADGPAGSTGPDSVTNDDLLQNKSNLIIKLNQVAASNTVKHDKVNGAKDIYGKCVNPTSDSGVTDGAGFAIDMSRYAMMDANPGFSAATVSAQTNLSGNTYITNGASANTYGTDTGHTLTIATTDVVDTNTNWTETITNKQSTVTNETDKITTLNESATTRNTTVGTETLHVSGTTTETHDKAVTITNNSGVTETTRGNVVENISGTTTITRTGAVTEDNKNNVTRTTSGTTTETFKGQVTENNLSAKTENTTGVKTENNSNNYVVNTTGNTTFNTTGSTTIQSTGAGSDVTIYAKDDLCATSDDVAAFRGVNKTNVGIDCSDTSRTKITNVYGDTINVRGNTADTRITSAYTSATTATTIIGTANTSATTADYSGNTLNSHIKSWTHSGDTLNITESTSTTLKSPATTVSGTTLTVDEGTSISAKTPSTTISGTNFTLNESNTTINSCGKVEITTDSYSLKQCSNSGGTADFEFCNGFNVKSNAVKFEQCGTAGTFTVTEKSTSLSGESLTIRESGATDFSGNTLTATTASNANVTIGGNLTEKVSGTTSIDRKGNVTENNQSNVTLVTSGTTTETKIGNVTENHSGTTVENNNGNVTVNNLASKTENTTGSHSIYSTGNTCVNSQANANFYGKGSTNIGVACDGSTKGSATTVYGTTTTISANTLNETSAGNTNINVGGNLVENVTGTTTINRTGAVVENNKGGLTVTTTGKTCMQSTTDVNIGGDSSTNIGVTCDGSVYSNNVGIYAQTAITETANTVNISGTSSVNVSGGTSVCISAGTNSNIYGPTTNVGVSCGGSTASTINVSGATINEGGTTINETFTYGNLNITNYDLNGDKICISGSTNANVYGATTNVGIDCNNTTTASTINISGTTINEGGKNINMYTTEKTCIQAGTDLNIGGDTTTNVGAKCDGTVYSNNTNIYAQTAVTINAPVTNITGDTYLSGKTYFNNTCSAVTINELSAALCEIKGRGEVTMTKTTPAATSEILATYRLFQNGQQIGEDINIPKDHLLKSAEIVYGKANGSNFTACTSTASDCHWYIKLVWNVFDPSTGHADDKVTYMPADNFIKDIDDDNSNANRGVNVDVWYDGKMNKVSADTTVKIVTDGNGTKTFTKSAGEHSLNSYKLTLTHNGLSNAVFDPFNASTALTLPHSALSIDYGVVVTGKTDDSYDTSAAKTVSIPTAVSHISRGTLSYSHNGFSGSFDPASDATFTSPHSALTIDYNVDVRQKADTSYDTSAAATVSIPGSLDHLSNYDGTNINIGHPTNINGAVCVTGTVTASGAIYSSDKNLKENINSLKGNKSIFDKVADVDVVSFNFKDDENKNTKYGVIAQDVQKAGLDELVYESNGNLGVDYTSLLMLKIAYLEDTIKNLTEKIEKLENK